MSRDTWVPLLVAVLAVLSDPCADRSSDLSCATDVDCTSRWGGWAPVCHAGVCSQCDDDRDCATRLVRPSECVDNVDGFGTCVPVGHP